MPKIFRIDMLPAREGDCLWLSWGDDEAHLHHALIDGGRSATEPAVRDYLAALPHAQRRLELLVISHIDRDHIEGVLSLLNNGLAGIQVADVWYNGRQHLQEAIETAGGVQGEALSQRIVAMGLAWNQAFTGATIMVPDAGPLPVVTLAGGLKLTVLSPTRAKLTALLPRWNAELERAGLGNPALAAPQDRPGFERAGALNIDALAAAPFSPDGAEPNGSSIALLAEYDGRTALLTADAHPEVLVASLARLAGANGGKLALDAMKVAHHGSDHNTSPALLDRIDCRRFLISTNGSYFNHPDAEAVARIIKRSGPQAELCFNYRQPQTEVWDNPAFQAAHAYRARYPTADRNGFLRVEIPIRPRVGSAPPR